MTGRTGWPGFKSLHVSICGSSLSCSAGGWTVGGQHPSPHRVGHQLTDQRRRTAGSPQNLCIVLSSTPWDISLSPDHSLPVVPRDWSGYARLMRSGGARVVWFEFLTLDARLSVNILGLLTPESTIIQIDVVVSLFLDWRSSRIELRLNISLLCV